MKSERQKEKYKREPGKAREGGRGRERFVSAVNEERENK